MQITTNPDILYLSKDVKIHKYLSTSLHNLK